MDCDGSGEGLGGALLQAYDEGENMVAYASRSLLEHEEKWTATELEAAGLIWASETFRPYIHGVHVTIRTDHAPLEYISSKTDHCKRLGDGCYGYNNLGPPSSRDRGHSRSTWIPYHALRYL